MGPVDEDVEIDIAVHVRIVPGMAAFEEDGDGVRYLAPQPVHPGGDKRFVEHQ